MRSAVNLALILAAGLLAFSLVQRAAERGLGYSPDSVSYFTMAEGIQDGKGFVDVRRYDTPAKPIYPPGYSILLAAGGLVGGIFGADLMASVPVVGGLLFAAAVMLFLWGLHLATDSRVLAAAGALFFFGSGDVVTLYTKVWSETAFLVATLAFMVLLARHLDGSSAEQDSQTYRWLVLAALAAGFAAIVRYPGVAAIGGGGLVLLLWPQAFRLQGLKRRVQHAAIFGGIASLPLALWLLRNIVIFGRPYLSKDRAASAAAFSSRNLELGVETLTRWTGAPTGVYLLIIALLAIGLAQLTPNPSRNPRIRAASLLVAATAFAIPYAAVMLAGTYGYGLHKPLDYRALSPIFGPLLWLLLLGAPKLAGLLPSFRGLVGERLAHRAASLQIIVTLGALAALAGQTAWSASDPEKAYGILQKKKRAVVEAFKDIEPTGTVFTNIDGHLYLLTGKPCLRLPQVYSLDGRDQPLPDFDEKMAELKSQLGDAGMIVYYSPSKRHYLPSEEELKALLPLEEVRVTGDGTIYRVKSSAPEPPS